MPSDLGLFDLEVVGRHLVAGLQRHHRHIGGARPLGRAGDIECFGHRPTVLVGLEVSGGLLVGGGPQRGAGCIHGDVAAADDDDLLAHVDVETLVGVDEELERPEHAVGIVARDVEAPAQRGAGGEEHGIVTLAQFLQGHIGAEAGAEPHVDTQADDRIDVPLEQIPVEAVLGDAVEHHPAETVGRFVEGDPVAEQAQVVGGGQTGRPPSDDADALGSALPRQAR